MIRHFGRTQRSQGIAVPRGRHSGDGGAESSGGLLRGAHRADRGSRGAGNGVRVGSAWVGVLVSLLALRFLLVDSLVGTHAAIVWVLEIGGILLVARVVLFSYLRRRRLDGAATEGDQKVGHGFSPSGREVRGVPNGRSARKRPSRTQ